MVSPQNDRIRPVAGSSDRPRRRTIPRIHESTLSVTNPGPSNPGPSPPGPSTPGPSTPGPQRYEALKDRLSAHGQDHVLRFWDQLDDAGRGQLGDQIDALDLDELDRLIAGQDTKQDFAAMAAVADSPPHVRYDGSGTDWTLDQARQAGEDALRAGKVAAVMVAGGQGTRLGFDLPKGMYPIGPVSERTLFQFFADTLRAVGDRYGVTIPWYVMTSKATDRETRDYFEQQDYFGLNRQDVLIFQQGTMPAVDSTSGKLLLAADDSLALSPDGHGGTVAALDRSGALDDADRRGVTVLSYIQVDNPLADLCDPTLIGHHLLSRSEMTTQVVRKRYPTEKVGNVVAIDGRVQIIEYSDLPESAARATDDEGNLRLWAGNIAVHVVDVAFLRRMSNDRDAFVFHRASKKVAYIDAAGKPVTPTEPNATKFEKFIFDLLPHANNAFVVECLPEQGFAPVKNADGAATDTPELAKQAIVALHRGWLEAAGATVADGVKIEINPRVALGPSDLNGIIPPGTRVEQDRCWMD